MNLNMNDMSDFKRIIGHEPYYGTPLLPYSQENDFIELNKFFYGKTVAIVGPAPDLIGQNKGSEIDNHDIVCKIGLMSDIIDYDNYGSKIDVLFSGCFPNLTDVNSFKNKGISRVICPIKPCIPGIKDVHNRDIWGHFNYLKSNLKEIKFYNIGLISCKFDNTYLGRASSGTFALYFLLNMPVKSLSVYGMTWYKNKSKAYHPHYRNGNSKYLGGHGVSYEIEKNGIVNTIDDANKEGYKKNRFYLNKEVYNSLYL
tara:strand:+ start:4064 stop:4831 length:768 start_codon:yes stop_codon:yes gene_type:complete